MSALIPCRYGDEIAENLTYLILGLAELQCRLNSQLPGVSAVKVKALTGKEWDPESWNGDMWEDPDGAGDTGPLNYDESS